jgi:hypothetical protein
MGKRKKKNWMKEAFSKNKGALHRELGVPQGQNIPTAKLNSKSKALESKEKLSATELRLLRRINAAKTGARISRSR